MFSLLRRMDQFGIGVYIALFVGVMICVAGICDGYYEQSIRKGRPKKLFFVLRIIFWFVAVAVPISFLFFT